MTAIVHRIAGVANAAAIILLLFLGNAGVLLKPDDQTPLAFSAKTLAHQSADGGAERAILIIVDGLRADTARDPRVMPFLCDLARKGGYGTAKVESLLPSTIAGIATLITGQVPPPASFLRDFRSPPAANGGIIQAIAEAGDHCFVAGPALWTDLYGKWIRDSRVAPALGGNDAPLLKAALAAVRNPFYRLVVLHLSQTDDAAHQYGAISFEYAQAARCSDQAIREIHDAIDSRTCMLVTSDHGVTDYGGHAGPEPHVLATPLVTAGPGMPQGAIGPIRQRDLPHLLAHALNLSSSHTSSVPASNPSAGGRVTGLLWLIALILVSLPCGIRFWSILYRPTIRRTPITLLNIAVWIVIALTMAAWLQMAMGIALFVLMVTAGSVTRGAIQDGLYAIGAGVVLAVLRLLDDGVGIQLWAMGGAAESVLSLVSAASLMAFPLIWGQWGLGWVGAVNRPNPNWRTWIKTLGQYSVIGPLGAGLIIAFWMDGSGLAAIVAVACLIGLAIGAALLRRAEHGTLNDAAGIAAGVLVATVPISFGRLLARTTSLSTLDVRAAYTLAESPLGIAAAVPVVILADALPALGLIIGVAPVLGRLRTSCAGAFAVGLIGPSMGQSIVYAISLACPGDVLPLKSMALGGLLHACADMLYLSLGSALLVMCNKWASAGFAYQEPIDSTLS